MKRYNSLRIQFSQRVPIKHFAYDMSMAVISEKSVQL